METERSIGIKICASRSDWHQCQTIRVLDTDTLAFLKEKIIERFTLNHQPNDLTLFYASPHSNPIQWETFDQREESQRLNNYSFRDGYIYTCEPTTHPKQELPCAPGDKQQRNCITNQQNIHPLPGLQNFGNTCFMNSALQCLNHVPSFFNYFCHTRTKELLNNEAIAKDENSILTQLYGKLIESFCSSREGAVIPIEFYRQFGKLAPRFANCYQHDSLEFLSILLDILHEGLTNILREPQTIVSQTFHIQMQTVVTCEECNKDVTTEESFSFLPLPIPEEDQNSTSSHNRRYKLDECFRKFLQGEHIGNNGQWYCQYCDRLTNARKKLSLNRLPPVLILQLKRFNYDLQSHAKNNTLIEYDLDNLDINEYVVGSNRDTSIRYNLIAVSNHRGSLVGGHFVTYAKLPETEDWYKYNDDQVGQINKNIHKNNCSAYILVYQQDKTVLMQETFV